MRVLTLLACSQLLEYTFSTGAVYTYSSCGAQPLPLSPGVTVQLITERTPRGLPAKLEIVFFFFFPSTIKKGTHAFNEKSKKEKKGGTLTTMEVKSSLSNRPIASSIDLYIAAEIR